MATVFIGMTIKVEVEGDKWAVRHQAEQVSSALNQLLRLGGAATIYTSVIEETEPDVVARLTAVTQ